MLSAKHRRIEIASVKVPTKGRPSSLLDRLSSPRDATAASARRRPKGRNKNQRIHLAAIEPAGSSPPVGLRAARSIYGTCPTPGSLGDVSER